MTISDAEAIYLDTMMISGLFQEAGVNQIFSDFTVLLFHLNEGTMR